MTKGQMLPLEDYRARIALDDGFVADAATCEQLPGLIRTIAFCAISTGVFGNDDREAYEAVLSPEAGHVEH